MRPSCDSSYGWSNEDRDGWPDRHYYTYYTTLGERDAAAVGFEAALYAFILAVSLVANVAILAAIVRRKEMRTVTNYLIGNLAFTDLVFALSIPPIIVARVSTSWTIGETMCKLLPYSQFVCGSVLLWTLTAISLDRVCCLTKAPYKSGVGIRTAIILIVIAWIVALMVFLPVAVFFRTQDVYFNSTVYDNFESFALKPSASATICTLVFPPNRTFNSSLAFTLTMLVISCILPMVVLVFNFQIILRKLAEIKTKIKQRTLSVEQFDRIRVSVQGTLSKDVVKFDDTSAGSPTKRHSSLATDHRMRKHKRAIRILFVNIFAVLAMWLPITIVMFLIYVDGHRADNQYFLSNQYFLWAVVIALTNTIVNPIIYGFLTENFRNQFPLYRWFRKICFKGSPPEKSSNSTSQISKNASIGNCGVENPVEVK